ncbi:MAG TPA: hypothetical protein VKY56_07210, partial [Chloroflexota bacterium]|nr:hypothetical protein [Chloroflexota bacterium]
MRCGGGRGSLFLGLVRRAVRRVVCRPMVGALAFYIVWSLVATYPLILAPTDHIENWGDPLLNVWIMAWDLHQLRRDPLHLFDAPIFYPARDTLALSELLLAQALQSGPIVALTGNFILAYNLIVISSYVLCGLGMYLLAREMLPSGPSLVAGAVYAYSFYRVGEFSHLQILSAQWIPLAILMLLRLWRHATWKRSLILAALVVIQALSSFYLGLFLVATLGFVLLLLILTDRRIPLRTLAPRLAGAGIIALAVLLPFSWPYFRVEREFGLSRTLDDAIGGSATPRSYLTVPPTSWLYGRVDLPILQHFPTDETLFPGLVPALLALVGLLAGQQRRWTAFFCALALFGVIMSFGPRFRLWTDRQPGLPLPYLLFYTFVPGFRSIRVVGRIGVIATLGLAGLAATGAAALLARAPARWRGWVSLGLALLVGGETLAIPVRMTPVETPAAIPPVYRWLASLPDTAPVLELPTIEARWLDRPSELERQGHEQYLSIYHWHPTPSGYSGFAPPLFWTTIREARDFPTAESIDFFQCLGLRYIIFHEAQMDPGRWQEVRGRLATFGSVLQPLARFGSDAVYRLADPPRLNQLPEPSIILPSMARAGDAYRFFLDWLFPGPVGRVSERRMLPVYLEWQGVTDRIRQDAVAEMPSCLRRGETSVP